MNASYLTQLLPFVLGAVERFIHIDRTEPDPTLQAAAKAKTLGEMAICAADSLRLLHLADLAEAERKGNRDNVVPGPWPAPDEPADEPADEEPQP